MRIKSLTPSAMQHEYTASASAVIYHMDGILAVDELNGPGGHRLENAMTMTTDVMLSLMISFCGWKPQWVTIWLLRHISHS